jgi:hypothetical protein
MAGQLLSLLAERPRLIVSLPANSAELGRAAAAGGADALKVHIHVTHDASGTRFASLAEERGNLEQILSLGLPTGIVPGAGERLPTREEMELLASMGMDFFDMYAEDMPAWLIGFQGMSRAVALHSPEEMDVLPDLEALGFELIEAALIPHAGYGRPLCAADIAAYHRLRRATKLPIIVPTQRAITPQEAAMLIQDISMNAIMIGAIVTGKEPDTLREATERFAEAVRRSS